MLLNRTSMWKVMTIGISRGHPLFNFKRLHILCPRIVHLCEKKWTFEFLESIYFSISSVSIYYVPESYIRVKSYDHLNFSRASVFQFRASRYIMSQNCTFEWKVITSWISRQVPLFNFESLNILCAWISREHIFFNFERLDILCPRVVHSSEKLWPFEFLERFCWSISSVSIYYAPESDIRVKSYDHWNFSRASVVPFQASRYIMSQNRTFVW